MSSEQHGHGPTADACLFLNFYINISEFFVIAI